MHQRGSFHLVLVADGSPATDAAACAVRDLIDPAAIGRISVVAVGCPFAFASGWALGMLGFVGLVPQALVDDLRERAAGWAAAEAERVVRLMGEVTPPVFPVARVGNAVDEIVAVARELGGDVVVVGSDGGAGTRRAAHGDIAARVMRRAPCPVLVVRPGAEEPPVSGKRVPTSGYRLGRPPAMPLVAGLGA
jgi:nucleotide-binding universal stress UspA family protein